MFPKRSLFGWIHLSSRTFPSWWAWRNLGFISNMGNIILQESSSKLVLKARELAKAYIWFWSKENWSDCCFCSQCVPEGGPPSCFFNTLLDPLCWHGNLEESWAALWTSEHQNLVGTGGTSRGAELNAVSRSRCQLPSQQPHPTPFPTWSSFSFLVPVTFLHCVYW